MADSSDSSSALDRYRRLTVLLERAIPIPGTSMRVGLDPLLGLIPGLGDLIGALLAAYGLVVALQIGAPLSLVGRMLANVVLDELVGSIPVAGDLFDFIYRANLRNLALLDTFCADPRTVTARSRRFWLAIPGALLVLIALTASLAFLTIRFLWSLLASHFDLRS